MKDYQDTKVISGLMRIDKLDDDQLYQFIKGCIKLDIHYFDISDIYLNHEAERKLGNVLKVHPELREEMFIQTKCGIVRDTPGKTWMDLSYDHIKQACNDSLRRMNLDYIDSFLLHRVDIFMDAKEISKALNELYEEGKVHHFGVSNMDSDMIMYIQSEFKLPLELNQLQVSLGQPALISETFNVNFPQQSPNLSNGLFFYLKRNHIRLQCWSPYQIGFFEGSIFDEKRLPEVNQKLTRLAEKYHTTKCSIATSFLSMLTPDCQVITGSMDISHIKETLQGSQIIMTREDWYDLYCSTGNLLP
jgi:predicted oxidoreductase